MPERKLVRDLAWALAIKLIALTAIYFLFFAAPARIDPARNLMPTIATSTR